MRHDGKTESAEEALTLLERHRKILIERARELAKEIAAREGYVCARDVRAAMVAEGSYVDCGSDRWLGAVFGRSSIFQRSGKLTRPDYADSPRASHRGTRIEMWELR